MNPSVTVQLVSWVFLVAIALIVAIVAVQVALIVIRVHRHRDAPQGCGNCGYNVRGLTTFKCPECGQDLREVGIDRKTALGPGFWVIMFSLDFLIIAIVAVLIVL